MNNLTTIHPQYIANSDGKNEFVVIPVAEFHAMVDEIEDNEDVRLYDEAKEGDIVGQRMLFCDYVLQRKQK